MHVGLSFGSCGRIRTADLTIMSRALSPTELHSHVSYLTLDKNSLRSSQAISTRAPTGNRSRDLHLTKMALYTELSGQREDRKSTRLNSSHVSISYAVFCLKKNTSW